MQSKRLVSHSTLKHLLYYTQGQRIKTEPLLFYKSIKKFNKLHSLAMQAASYG